MDEKTVEIEPSWKRIVRVCYFTFAVSTVAAFPIDWGISAKAFSSGSVQPTAEKPVAYRMNGSTRYISEQELYWMNLFAVYLLYTIPTALASGFFLYFVLKIDLFGDKLKKG